MFNKYIRIRKAEDRNLKKFIEVFKASNNIKQIEVTKECIIGKDQEGNDFIIQYRNDSTIEIEFYISATNATVVEIISDIIKSNTNEYADDVMEDNYAVLRDIRNNTKTIKNGVVLITTIVVFYTVIVFLFLFSQM